MFILTCVKWKCLCGMLPYILCKLSCKSIELVSLETFSERGFCAYALTMIHKQTSVSVRKTVRKVGGRETAFNTLPWSCELDKTT